MSKKKRIILLCFLGALCVTFQTSEVFASSEVQLDLLIKKSANIELVKQEIVKLDQNVDFEEIPEIQLLRVKSTDSTIRERISKNDQIEFSGKLPDILVEDDRLSERTLTRRHVLPESVTQQDSDEFEILDQLAWYKDMMLPADQIVKSKGEGVRLGLIDSGIDIFHPLLSSSADLTQAKSFVEEDLSIADTNGHGTMVAGMIAQLAPNTKITPYRVLSAGSGDSFWTLEAIVQAVNDRQDILNMSLGTYKYETIEAEKMTIETFERAVNYALANNVIVVSSSGNKGLDLDIEYANEGLRHLPGSIPGVLSTSGITMDRLLASYSNIGSNVQYAAPGGDYVYIDGMLDITQLIYTSYPTTLDNGLSTLGIPQGYMFTAGTSLAAPCISGIIADYVSYYRRMTGVSPLLDRIKKDLAVTSEDFGITGKDKEYGYGLPNLMEMYELVPDTLPPTGIFNTQIIEINTPRPAEVFVTDVQDNSAGKVKISFAQAPDFSILGKQKITICLEDISGNRSELVGEITIADTQAPSGEFVDQIVEVNQPNSAREYVKNVQDNSQTDIQICYATKPDFSKLGEQQVAIKLVDIGDNQTVLTGKVKIVDIQPPSGIFKERTIMLGEIVFPEMFVEQISDNYDADAVTVEFADSVDTKKSGKKEVAIRLSDSSDNSVILKGNLTVLSLSKNERQFFNTQLENVKRLPGTLNPIMQSSNKQAVLSSRKNLPNTSEKLSLLSSIGCVLIVVSLYGFNYHLRYKSQ